MYKRYNANPIARRADDCTIRAISKILNKSWDEVYCSLCEYGRYFFDMPSANRVWGQYLLDHNYKRLGVPASCPLCYTVSQFVEEHPKGRFILALNGHVVACIDGDYYDSWDSGDETVLYYWKREE